MPLYVFRCSREDCGREVEVLQKYEDPPPTAADDEGDGELSKPCAASPTQEPCTFERAPTTFTQRWRGTYGNEGRDGWTRQGEFMIRASKGRSTEQPG